MKFNTKDMDKLMASDFMNVRYAHALNIIASLTKFMQWVENLAHQEHLLVAVSDISSFTNWYLSSKLKKLYAGKDLRSKLRNNQDLRTLEGFPTPAEIKQCVQKAIVYIQMVSDYVSSPDAELDWGWARLVTMLMVGVIFFSTIAGQLYNPRHSRPPAHKEVHCSEKYRRMMAYRTVTTQLYINICYP